MGGLFSKMMELQIVVHGPQNSGKNCFMFRTICDNYLDFNVATCGASILGKIILVEGKKLKLTFWDIGGDERSSQLAARCTKNASAVILFYDSSDDLGFEKIPGLVDFYKTIAAPNLLLFIVGNKVDLGNNTPAIEKAVNFCNESGIKHFLASPKTGENVNSIVQEVAETCLR